MPLMQTMVTSHLTEPLYATCSIDGTVRLSLLSLIDTPFTDAGSQAVVDSNTEHAVRDHSRGTGYRIDIQPQPQHFVGWERSRQDH